jgi:hypothetical protein
LTLTLALVIQVVVELEALASGAWVYNDRMPLIPWLNVGLTPVVQMPLLVLPVFWLARRMLCSLDDDRSDG